MHRTIFRIAVVVVLLGLPVLAQDPGKWSLSSSAQGKTLSAGDTLKVMLRAEIESGWHLYALDQPAGGPIATTIKLTEGKPFEVTGAITSTPKPTSKTDPLFTGDDGKPLVTRTFTDSVTFDIPLKATGEVAADSLSFDVRFQVCDETRCLPPKTVRVSFAGVEAVRKAVSTGPTAPVADGPSALATSTRSSSTDLWSFIWLAITFGAISLLTPCVFPMIPITVSYFMKHSDGDHRRTIKLATVYSVGIIATFSLLGMLLAVVFGAAGINLFGQIPGSTFSSAGSSCFLRSTSSAFTRSRSRLLF
jgi:thiol:disulfide interchange protein DsbD